MRAAKCALLGLFGLFATLPFSVGDAQSQEAMIRVCNRSNVRAYVAITAHPAPGDSSFRIKGWWNVSPGECMNTEYVAWGWVYLYAEGTGNVEWRGSDERYCVTYPGPFERTISAAYSCSGNVLKSFTGYYIDVDTFTWNLN